MVWKSWTTMDHLTMIPMEWNLCNPFTQWNWFISNDKCIILKLYKNLCPKNSRIDTSFILIWTIRHRSVLLIHFFENVIWHTCSWKEQLERSLCCNIELSTTCLNRKTCLFRKCFCLQSNQTCSIKWNGKTKLLQVKSLQWELLS